MTISRITSKDNIQNDHSLFVCRQLKDWKNTEPILVTLHTFGKPLAGNINHKRQVQCYHEHNTADLL